MVKFEGLRYPCVGRAGRQQGLGLIEILVAVLILAIGLLGLAALQSNALRLSSEAQVRSQAILLASDLTERIRTNRANASDYAQAMGEPANCNPNLNIGAGENVAARDMAEWRNSVACLLVAGDAGVQVAETEGGAIRITITMSYQVRQDGVMEDETVVFQTEA